MSNKDWCADLYAMRQQHLDQADWIRSRLGDLPTDPEWQRILQRHDDTATDLDSLMIKAGCMKP
ncbi:hypothetical protein B5M44_24915 [Shinella sumterensis]|nr:hypothetical protein B5M44_24915 [Shinella sumterensis]